MMQLNNGFSLIELIIVMLIISIIAALSSQPLFQGLKIYTTTQEIGMLDWQSDFALERMSRIIRTVPKSGSITTASANQFSFTNNQNTAYSYSLSAGNLLENSNILAGNASALAFTYYDETGTATTTLSAIRFVQVALTLSLNNNTYNYTTSINLPNIN